MTDSAAMQFLFVPLKKQMYPIFLQSSAFQSSNLGYMLSILNPKPKVRVGMGIDTEPSDYAYKERFWLRHRVYYMGY